MIKHQEKKRKHSTLLEASPPFYVGDAASLCVRSNEKQNKMSYLEKKRNIIKLAHSGQKTLH
jgi:hypothetical protein